MSVSMDDVCMDDVSMDDVGMDDVYLNDEVRTIPALVGLKKNAAGPHVSARVFEDGSTSALEQFQRHVTNRKTRRQVPLQVAGADRYAKPKPWPDHHHDWEYSQPDDDAWYIQLRVHASPKQKNTPLIAWWQATQDALVSGCADLHHPTLQFCQHPQPHWEARLSGQSFHAVLDTAAPVIERDQCSTNSHWEIFRHLGVLALTHWIYEHVQAVMRENGITLSPRHPEIMARFMTSRGVPCPMSHTGMGDHPGQTFENLSSETTRKWNLAARRGETDLALGTHTASYINQLAPLGTGQVDIQWQGGRHVRYQEAVRSHCPLRTRDGRPLEPVEVTTRPPPTLPDAYLMCPAPLEPPAVWRGRWGKLVDTRPVHMTPHATVTGSRAFPTDEVAPTGLSTVITTTTTTTTTGMNGAAGSTSNPDGRRLNGTDIVQPRYGALEMVYRPPFILNAPWPSGGYRFWACVFT